MDNDADDVVVPEDIAMRFVEGDTITYWVTVDPGMTVEEREQLEGELDAPDEGVEIQHYGGGPGITEIALAVSILANVATTAQATTGVFTKLNKWLQQRKLNGKTAQRIRVERTIVIREKIEVSADNAEELRQFFTGHVPEAE